jgi:transposase
MRVVCGVGPVVAAAVIGGVATIRRFPTRDRFAAYSGTAPIEASSCNGMTHRLSRRGNRYLIHAIPMAAVAPTAHRGTTGGAAMNARSNDVRQRPRGPVPRQASGGLGGDFSAGLDGLGWLPGPPFLEH